MYLDKKARLCQRVGRWHSLFTCPCVVRFESRIKHVVGRVCRKSPFLYSLLMYVAFESVLEVLTVILEVLSALAYESLEITFPVGVWGYISRTLVSDAGIGEGSSHLRTGTFWT